MGALISRWRTKQTTVEQLESLDKEIKELEEFRTKNQRLQKLWVGRLLLYSSVLYLFTSLLVYFLYFPDKWLQRLAMALPFFLYPGLVWLIRKVLIFLFSKRTERNNDKLEDLKASKKKILEEVMETETYKNAKLILERFDPDARKKAELESTPVRPQVTPRPGQEIRHRGVPMRPMPMGSPAAMAMTPQAGPRPPVASPVAPGGPPERSTPSTSAFLAPVHRTPCSPIPGVGMHPPGPPLARPILPKDRGAVDRVIEYLVGDGPQNRYALICQQCFSHNGMALKEEFEYLAFRCAYCYFLNPARKTRPQAPRLPEFSYERKLRAEPRSPGPSQRPGTEPEESASTSGDEKEAGEQEQPGGDLDVDVDTDVQLEEKQEGDGGEGETEEQQQEDEKEEEEEEEERPTQEEEQQSPSRAAEAESPLR